MSTTLHAWAKYLKSKTDKGAALFLDGELWPHPEWHIGKDRISFTCGNTTQMVLEPGADRDEIEEIEADMRKRIRVLVDA